MDTTAHTPAIQAQIDGLKESIQLVDNFSQDGFSRIDAIAMLALLAMETPEGHRDIEVYAKAFEAIRAITCDMKNLINLEAEKTGDHYRDEAWPRRSAARRAFRSAQERHGGVA